MKKAKTQAEWREMRKVSNAIAKRMYTSTRFPAKVIIPGHTDPRVPSSAATIEHLAKKTGLSKDIVVGQLLNKHWDGKLRFPRLPKLEKIKPAAALN